MIKRGKYYPKPSMNAIMSWAGPVESYICARPADTIDHVSTWGNARIFYEPVKMVEAWEFLYQSRNRFNHCDTYEYDLVDVTRQVLSDYAKYLHKEMVEAFHQKNKNGFMKYSTEFLDVIKDEDRLLSTRKEFDAWHLVDGSRKCRLYS